MQVDSLLSEPPRKPSRYILTKNPPAVQETWVQSLVWEDPLEKGTSTPLQYSCLENPTGRGAWQAAVHGVAKESDIG